MISAIKSISTRHLILRKYEESDAAELKSAVDETLEHLLPWMPWAKLEPQTIEDKRKLIKGFMSSFESGEDYVFGAFTREGELAASTGLHLRAGPDAFETGYWTRKKFRGQGFATECAYAMTRAAFEAGGVKRMVIKCDEKNEISAKIPLKLGYVYRGTGHAKAHDSMHMVFELGKSDFQRKDDYEPVQIIFLSKF